MKLSGNRYGKAKVRLLKVNRTHPAHSVKELTVRLLLTGDFGPAYVSGDNRRVVATDSLKNLTNVLAHEHLDSQTEPFVLYLADFLQKKYSWVESVQIDTEERVWRSIAPNGGAHFQAQTDRAPVTHLLAQRDSVQLRSGIQDLVILKTEKSGFSDFWRDEFTTLPEMNDRLLATRMTASWEFSRWPANFEQANNEVLGAMLDNFTQGFSPSVQSTMYNMGEAGLRACSEVSRIDLTMPNLHYLLINLAPFKRENRNELFLPTEEPQGWIEATVTRE